MNIETSYKRTIMKTYVNGSDLDNIREGDQSSLGVIYPTKFAKERHTKLNISAKCT